MYFNFSKKCKENRNYCKNASKKASASICLEAFKRKNNGISLSKFLMS